jgi:hypothetical protein
MLKLFAPFVLFASLLVSNGQACPFCPNVQSLSDEMASMEAAVIARAIRSSSLRGPRTISPGSANCPRMATTG